MNEKGMNIVRSGSSADKFLSWATNTEGPQEIELTSMYKVRKLF